MSTNFPIEEQVYVEVNDLSYVYSLVLQRSGLWLVTTALVRGSEVVPEPVPGHVVPPGLVPPTGARGRSLYPLLPSRVSPTIKDLPRVPPSTPPWFL